MPDREKSSIASGSRPVVLMVCTRDIPEKSESGRERTLAFVRRSLEASGRVEFFRVHSLLERRSWVDVMLAMGRGLLGLVTARPRPLQSLLFTDARVSHRLLDEVARLRPEAVYFDGIRSIQWARGLRKAHPGLRIICDFDDLMSRRMRILADLGQPISMGYLRGKVPVWVQRYVLDGLIARVVLAYEHRALAAEELRALASSDAQVLVSDVDARYFKQQIPRAPESLAVIPPYLEAGPDLLPLPEVKRFVFIGADSLLQNRQTVEYLVSLWLRLKPGTPLHLYGKLTHEYPAVAGVSREGFVDSLAQVYEPGSVMLAPSFLSGGVKTKVLEAFSHGVPVIGTAITFEGIQADCRGLTGSEDALADWVTNPQVHRQAWVDAAAQVLATLKQSHGEASLAAQWQQLVWPSPPVAGI